MPDRPNFLVICADMAAAKHFGCYGGPAGLTPHIDSIAGQGIRFDQAYCAGPPCIPARASMMTGLWPHTHGKSAHIRMPIEPSIVTLPRALEKQGYRTGVVGKTHWWPAADPFGFGEAELTIDRHLTPELGKNDAYLRFLEDRGLFHYNPATWKEDMGKLRASELPEDARKVHWTGSATCGMLDRFAQGDRPFFLFCSFVEPHGGGGITDDLFQAVQDRPFPPRIPPGGRGKPWFIEQAAAAWEAKRGKDAENYRRRVAASLHEVDVNVGRILHRMARLKLAENTVVVFLTDHGDFCLDHGLIEKTIPYEPAVRIPFAMAGPGITAGGTSTQLTSQIDLMPTLMDYAGADALIGQGRSLRTLAEGMDPPWREALFCECDATVHLRNAGLDLQSAQAKMVRQENWKYIYWLIEGQETAEELYDLAADPDEKENLAAHENHRARCSELRGRLLDWLIATEMDRIRPDPENDYPVPRPRMDAF